MPSKKIKFSEDEEQIFDDAVILKRGDYWQFRMWLTKEHKYARFSLKTRNKSTAIDKAKVHYHSLMSLQLQGKSYFSITTKIGVEKYLEQRWKDVEAGIIVKGRYATIKTHLEHWLEFIGRDTKLKELERTDCENYYHTRTKTKKGTVLCTPSSLPRQCLSFTASRKKSKRGIATPKEDMDIIHARLKIAEAYVKGLRK